MAALAAAVAGESASVASIVPAGADAEAYGPRPGDVEKLQRADVVVRVGLGYDYWLDRLLAQSANAQVMRGGDGYVDASAGIPLLDVRSASVANDSGHSHGAANPHYWLDPHNADHHHRRHRRSVDPPHARGTRADHRRAAAVHCDAR